jgi:hypothetical protein
MPVTGLSQAVANDPSAHQLDCPDALNSLPTCTHSVQGPLGLISVPDADTVLASPLLATSPGISAQWPEPDPADEYSKELLDFAASLTTALSGSAESQQRWYIEKFRCAPTVR